MAASGEMEEYGVVWGINVYDIQADDVEILHVGLSIVGRICLGGDCAVK